MYARVDARDLEPDALAVGEIEKLGAATLTKIRTWVGHHQVVIQPVLNMARRDAVDSHDPPGWMRDLVHLRDGHCIFPRCHVDARSCDLDHTIPYDETDHPAKPGQRTSPACAGDTTAPRPPVAGGTSARPTATTSGTARTARRTSSPTAAPIGCPDFSLQPPLPSFSSRIRSGVSSTSTSLTRSFGVSFGQWNTRRLSPDGSVKIIPWPPLRAQRGSRS